MSRVRVPEGVPIRRPYSGLRKPLTKGIKYCSIWYVQMQLVFLTVRVHLFPFRTQKLSSPVPKILVWRRTGKIGQCQHSAARNRGAVFLLLSKFSPTGVEPASVFIGRIYAHTSLLPLQIRQVFPAVNASSGRKSAPEKLLCTFRRELFG